MVCFVDWCFGLVWLLLFSGVCGLAFVGYLGGCLRPAGLLFVWFGELCRPAGLI